MSKRSTSYTSAAKLVSTVPLICICQVTPAAGFQKSPLGGEVAWVAVDVDERVEDGLATVVWGLAVVFTETGTWVDVTLTGEVVALGNLDVVTVFSSPSELVDAVGIPVSMERDSVNESSSSSDEVVIVAGEAETLGDGLCRLNVLAAVDVATLWV